MIGTGLLSVLSLCLETRLCIVMEMWVTGTGCFYSILVQITFFEIVKFCLAKDVDLEIR